MWFLGQKKIIWVLQRPQGSICGLTIFDIPKKIKIDAKGDHRIAMSFYVLSQVLNKSFKIKDFNYVKTSFPSFTKTINNLRKN